MRVHNCRSNDISHDEFLGGFRTVIGGKRAYDESCAADRVFSLRNERSWTVFLHINASFFDFDGWEPSFFFFWGSGDVIWPYNDYSRSIQELRWRLIDVILMWFQNFWRQYREKWRHFITVTSKKQKNLTVRIITHGESLNLIYLRDFQHGWIGGVLLTFSQHRFCWHKIELVARTSYSKMHKMTS